MRKIVPIVLALGLAGVASFTAGSAATPAQAPTRQQIAQKILDHAVLTASAHAYFAALARGDQRLAADPPSQKIQGQANASGQGPAGSGLTNIQVSNPGEDVHQTEQTTQSETSIAVSGANVAVGFNDSQTTLLFLTPGSDLSGYAYSHDGGATFTDGGALPNNPPSINFGDPWLATDSVGTMYYSNLVDNPNVGLLVGVSSSTNGGQTWTAPSQLPEPALSPNTFFGGADKDALTASASGLFDGWDDFTVTSDPNTKVTTAFSGLPVAHSTDGGRTWSTVYAAQTLNFTFGGPTPNCTSNQFIGAQPLVAGNTVFDFALKFGVTDPNCTGTAPFTEEEDVFTSTDGGQTWSAGTKIADVSAASGSFFCCFQVGPGQFIRDLELPSVAAANGKVYAAWNGNMAGHSKIILATSADNGTTWKTSQVTQGNNEEIQPAVSADSSGLHVLYYQLSPAGNGTEQIDVFAANHTNGSSFKAKRVSSQSFPGVYNAPNFDPIIAFGYMGDYIANVSDGTNQYFSWGDNRDVVTNFLWPQGRHDPDVFFAKQ